jgi:HD-like signal output (HDOD) protein
VKKTELIERAVEHVSQGWIPPHPEVLDRIQNGLHTKRYEKNRAQLKKDLKEDLGLYVYCLRELMKLVASSNENGEEESSLKPEPRSFQDILETTPIETLTDILDVDARKISTHRMSEISDIQAQRFEETFLSATTSEVLAGAGSVDPELGFSCAVLRQLGLMLIAWNYPRVYARANLASESPRDLDKRLKTTLGFTPTLLATRLAKEWSLSEVMVEAIATPGGRIIGIPRLGKDSSTTAQFLSKICCVGEALARAKHPDTYPTALSDWESAQEVIGAYLGAKGVEQIFKQAERYLTAYHQQSPEQFKRHDVSDIKGEIINVQHGARRLEQNTYLAKLPEQIRCDFATIYMRMRANSINENNIRELAKDLAPKYGFPNLAIFIFEPDKKLLSAAIHVGSCFSDRLASVRVNSTLGHLDFIASAFSLKTPTREDRMRGDENISCIAASLGVREPVGVLYMETSEEYQRATGLDTSLLFQAFRKAIGDSLNLD